MAGVRQHRIEGIIAVVAAALAIGFALLLPGDIIALAAAGLAFVFAGFLWAARPATPAARRLANVVAFEGLQSLFLGLFMMLEYPSLESGQAGWIVHPARGFTTAIIPWFYLLFLGTPETRWFGPFSGRRAVLVGLTGASAGVGAQVAAIVWLPSSLDVVHEIAAGTVFTLVTIYALAGHVIGAWRVRRGQGQHPTGTFLVTFGMRDVLYAVFFLGFIGFLRPWGFDGPIHLTHLFDYLVIPGLILFVYVPLAFYGIRTGKLLPDTRSRKENHAWSG